MLYSSRLAMSWIAVPIIIDITRSLAVSIPASRICDAALSIPLALSHWLDPAAPPLLDRRDDLLIRRLRLPLRVYEIARVNQLTAKGLGRLSTLMARSAVILNSLVASIVFAPAFFSSDRVISNDSSQ